MQAACASAIRNIVCRDKGLGAQFIDLGVEDLLNLALLKHGDKVNILIVITLFLKVKTRPGAYFPEGVSIFFPKIP